MRRASPSEPGVSRRANRPGLVVFAVLLELIPVIAMAAVLASTPLLAKTKVPLPPSAAFTVQGAAARTAGR